MLRPSSFSKRVGVSIQLIKKRTSQQIEKLISGLNKCRTSSSAYAAIVLKLASNIGHTLISRQIDTV